MNRTDFTHFCRSADCDSHVPGDMWTIVMISTTRPVLDVAFVNPFKSEFATFVVPTMNHGAVGVVE